MSSGTLMVFNGPGLPMQFQTRELPELSAGEVLVRNVYTTLCGSDLHTFCGLRKENTPTVLGHEIVGKVVEISESHSGKDFAGNVLNEGDIVTWSIFSADPASEMSKLGMPQKTPGVFKYGHATVTEKDAFHGGLAEYCLLKPHTAILKIPDNVSLPVAATLNCAVATVAGALRHAGTVKGKTVLITGTGLLGMVCAAMCKDAGAEKIIAADISPQRLQQSLAFGVEETCLMTPGSGAENESALSSLDSEIDIVFDMSGSPEAMEEGVAVLGIGGVAVWVGAVFRQRKVMLDAEQIIRRLITVKGLHNYNYEDFVYAVDFMRRNAQRFPFEQIIGKEFSLSEAEQAFEYALTNRPLRVGIRIEGQ
ncbi:Alcohol dehydrogenase zinc-binding domain protein [Runella slithyformis DSM 19594]|uniref:alcohol dehydrogenase n=2 Tax=Runella TaxID=105 RepID=A0A7U3ZPT9_RUNSL|nr:Alcohol dehydrogenase zinc-binding domain protein [Runella slithyformis DSM 19594]